MKFRFFLIILIFSSALFAGKRAITFEDFFSMKRLGGYALSPDKSKILYDVTLPDIDGNTFHRSIYLLDLNTGTSQKLAMEGNASHAVWLEDNSGFLYNTGGQISRFDLKKNSTTEVTAFKPGAANALIRPGGEQFVFVSEVDPNCADPDCMERHEEAFGKRTVKARVITQLMFRHWNRWLEGKRSHLLLADRSGKVLKDLTPGDYDTPPLDLGSARDYAFSPDGRMLAFVRNMDDMVAISTNNDIFLYDMESGKTTRLTGNKANDNQPVFSPDGRWLAWRAMSRPGFEADRYRLMVKNLKTGETRDLTQSFSLSTGEIVWQADSRGVYFTAAEEGAVSIYHSDLNGNRKAVLKGHYLSGLQVLNDHTLLFKKQTAAMPYELFRFDTGTKKMEKLTRLNDALLSELELPRLQKFWFTGAKGDSVMGWIMTPPFFDKNKVYPAVQLIHGGPQGAWGDDFHFRWSYQMFAAPGYVIWAVNFHGSTGYGQDFTDAVSRDWGGAPYQDLLLGTDYVLKNYPFIDAGRLGAAGASYGGFMINWIAGHENPFKCLVSHDGVFDQRSMYGATEELWFPEWEFGGPYWKNPELYEKWSPSNLAGNFKTPMLVIHGEHDYRVPYTQGLQLFTALQRQGVDSQLLFFPDEDHFVTKPQNARLWWHTVHNWLGRYLK